MPRLYLMFAGSRDLKLEVDYTWHQVMSALLALEPGGVGPFGDEEESWWQVNYRTHLAHGGARGPDTELSEAFADENGSRLLVPEHYSPRLADNPYVLEPDWSKGRHAGMLRNEDLVRWLVESRDAGTNNYACAVVVWDCISSGTRDTIERLVAHKVPHRVIRVPREPSKQTVLFA